MLCCTWIGPPSSPVTCTACGGLPHARSMTPRAAEIRAASVEVHRQSRLLSRLPSGLLDFRLRYLRLSV